jgi:hypothetical protein
VNRILHRRYFGRIFASKLQQKESHDAKEATHFISDGTDSIGLCRL